MKKLIIILIASIMLSGCMLPASYSTRNIVRTYNDFTCLRVLSEGDDTSIGSLTSLGEISFKEFGSDSSFVAEFVRTNETYTVEIVSFSAQRGALGAYFSMQEPPQTQPLALDDYARKTDRFVQFVKRNYVVFVTPMTNGTIKGAEELAIGLAKRMGKTIVKPNIYEELPTTNIVDKTSFFFMGKKIFTSRFPVKLAESLHISESLYGLSANYSVDGDTMELLKIRYPGRQETLGAVKSFLTSKSDRPIIQPRESLTYYTVIEPDHAEDYIAENGEWLYLAFSAPYNKKPQKFFEYLIRGGQ